MDWAAQAQVLGEVLLAVVLGGLIGLERELAKRPAGLRTHILVVVSSTLMVTLGNVIVSEFQQPDFVTVDPIRIIEAVVVGISFLGAGTILRHRDEGYIEGLTTAASILVAAAIGTRLGKKDLYLNLYLSFISQIYGHGRRSMLC
jgi:putative Mg2+ transporter-C (MgtC) family protein